MNITEPPKTGFNFQVNLKAIIDLLSNHLYSGPEVYLRELLQNCVDAITARQQIDSKHRGEITFEVVPARQGQPIMLIVEDNGVGLTMDEIHTFLATIGSSSKREDLGGRRADYIGQFGIGLLSCFIVTEEMVLITRSAKPDQPGIEWRGKADGTYQIRLLDKDIAPGTKVFLRARRERAAFFAPAFVRERMRHYGALLPFPISVAEGNQKCLVNDKLPPWKMAFTSEDDRRTAYLEYGRETLGAEFIDCIPLMLPECGVEGAAFVLPHSPNLAAKKASRVYLKGMLVTDRADNLLPDWAFFVKCVINSSLLRPTASRESLYEDEALFTTRQMLGQALRNHLVHLSNHDHEGLQKIISVHGLAIKALAVHDDEFYKLVIGCLPFQTSLGVMTLDDYKQRHAEVCYVARFDEFRQIAQVAAAQSLGIINAGCAYDGDLMAKHAELFPDCPIRRVTLPDLVASLTEVGPEERKRGDTLVAVAAAALRPFGCRVEMKHFKPAELPVLYTTSDEGLVLRSVEQAKGVAPPMWGQILRRTLNARTPYHAELCFNYANPRVQRLLAIESPEAMRLVVESLYLQALLMGHHSLQAREMELLNQGLSGLIGLAVGKGKEA